MKNSIAIAKKELNIYFATPIAYAMFTLFIVVGSYFFLQLIGVYESASLQYMRMQDPAMLSRLNFQDIIFRNLYGTFGGILIFVVPFLTMRLLAEEKRQKTIELLYTTPVTSSQIVLGKFLAAAAILLITLALTLTYPILVQMFAGDPNGVDWRCVSLAYLGVFLLGSGFIAIGLFISSLTESQVVAALATWAVLLLSWFIAFAGRDAGQSWVRELANFLSSGSHLDSFTKGTLALKDLTYFLSIIVLALFGTNRAVEAHRWS
jgi:ABC-2 type transport system permease protein